MLPMRLGVLVLLRPRVMAMLAIVVFFHQPRFRKKAGSHIRQQRVSGKLRVVHVAGVAFGAANRITKRSFRGIPGKQKLFGAAELVRRDFHVHARSLFRDKPELLQPKFPVNLRSNPSLDQALLQQFGLGVGIEENNGNHIHVLTAQGSPGFGYPFLGKESIFLVI